MAPPPPANFEALDGQSRTLLSVFIAGGHEAVAPPIIQPAGVFLDVLGEALRGRTYVFSDPDGQELCLRPDLTVPTCRLYLRAPPAGRSAGALLLQRAGVPLSARERGRRAPARVPPGRHRSVRRRPTARTRMRARWRWCSWRCSSRACAAWKLRIGDLGLFAALLEGAEMPERWRRRLRHQFWRPDAFRAELRRLTTNPARFRRACRAH